MAVDFPEKLSPLFLPVRYKVLWGGRGAAKSWGVARALVIIAAQRTVRILCARELQNSIADSVHKLLSDQIEALGLSNKFDIGKNYITALDTGSQFLFAGLKHNVNSIKSTEGIDIVWVEEGQLVSKSSWETLIPTIRKEGSEIWVTFNPDLDTDETYRRFVVHTPTNAWVEHMTWRDNPWFPSVLAQEMADLKARDPDEFTVVWEGRCRQALQGAIYEAEIRKATEEGRICKVPYSRAAAVSVYADLGWRDRTTLLFGQRVGMESRLLRGYQNSQQPWPHYLDQIQNAGFLIREVCLPHDARAKSLGTGKSIEELTREAGFKVRIVPNLSIEEGISAARSVFAECWFDEEGCGEFLQFLRRYRYDVKNGQVSREPLHDDASHYADAFRYFAVAGSGRDRRSVAPEGLTPKFITTPSMIGGGWMA